MLALQLFDSLLEVAAAWLLVDALTGIYHLATDRGWNRQWICDLFEDHHTTNTMDGFDWQPMVASVPVMLLGLWLASSFLLAAGAFGCLAQIPHYYAHRPPRWRFIRWLQVAGLMITPEHHAGHHAGDFDRNFCIFSGANDWWLNRLVPLVPFRQ